MQDSNHVQKPKMCVVATVGSAITVALLPHIREWEKRFDVTVACGSRPTSMDDILGSSIRFVHFDIRREISLLDDLKALGRAILFFRKERFEYVHSITPKAGLIAMLAAAVVGVPFRLHSFTGQVWATQRSWRRYVLKKIDRLTYFAATHILCDGPLQVDFLVREGVAPKSGLYMLANGSIAGVDIDRFRPNQEWRRSIRAVLDIPDDAVVLIFLGRLKRDKGVLDLVAAFHAALDSCDNIRLLLIGADEDLLTSEISSFFEGHRSHLYILDYVHCPEQYLAASDVFCLPSYREGFNTALLEAAATCLPAVASRIYGISDVVEEGRTALLNSPGDVRTMMMSVRQLATDRLLRQRMGAAARFRVTELFQQKDVVAAMQEFYLRLPSGDH